MWELDYKESWAPKNWCFWTVVLEKTLERSLDYKEIKPLNPKGNQSWICTGRTDAEAEAPILWPPDAKNWFTGKDSDVGRLRTGREGDDRGWHGWMASPTQRTWVSVRSRSWWWTGKPGVLQFMGSQRVWHNWVTELNWSGLKNYVCYCLRTTFCISILLNFKSSFILKVNLTKRDPQRIQWSARPVLPGKS